MYPESLITQFFNEPIGSLQKAKRKLEHRIEDVIRSVSQSHIISTVINQKEIRIIGLRRSGNHAIIRWLEKQQTGEVLHLNNIRVNENPYRDNYENLLRKNNSKNIERWQQEARGFFTKKDCLLYSYEDYSLNQIANRRFEKTHDLYFGKSAERYDVIIMRDPFNLLASRIQQNYRAVKAPQKTDIDLWIEYAKEYLGETEYLKHNKVTINYNRWFNQVDYRQEIASRLNLEFSDDGFHEVSQRGGGSSFDGREFHGKATAMDVLGRWKVFAEDTAYRKLFDNKELLEYSETIFGSIPGTKFLEIS